LRLLLSVTPATPDTLASARTNWSSGRIHFIQAEFKAANRRPDA
jgi:hypothetical protein